MDIFKSLLNFIYPLQCEVCGRLLAEGERVLCSSCFLDLPRTNFHLDDANQVARLFWGRVQVSHAAAFYYYNKGSPYQKLIHKLKYNGKKDIGIFLGQCYAAEIRHSVFTESDLVMPVPLHPRKQRVRGYNQAEVIGQGICHVLQKSLITGNLVRLVYTDTQTKRRRYDRFTNTEGIFGLKDSKSIHDRHVLLVDDVVTTGSTLEACAGILLNAGCREVSLLAIAVA